MRPPRLVAVGPSTVEPPAPTRQTPDPDLLPVQFCDIQAPVGVDRWAIEGLLRCGSWGLLASTPGLGKTQMLREIALRAALGKGPVFERYPLPSRLRTLVIDEENGPAEEWRREEMIRVALGVERADVAGYFRTSWYGLDLLDPGWQNRLETWIECFEIELLILDAISDMYSVKELREYLGPIGTFFKRLLLRFPTLAILASHHLRKMPPGEAQAERMLSDLRGGFWDQQAQMVALAWSLGERRVRLAVRKRVPNHDGIFEQTDAGLLRFVADAHERPTANDDRVMASIDAGATAVDEVVLATGLPERTAWNAVKRLRKAGLLVARGALQRPLEDRA